MKRNGKTEKRRILLLLLAGVWLLCGFGKGSVELKSEVPLIDLDLLVQDSVPGKYGNAESGLDGKTEETNAEGKETDEEESADAEGRKAGTEPVTEIRVVIRDTAVRVNDVPCRNTEEMMSTVNGLYRVGLKVYLVDDYAEYSAYTEAYRLLREQNKSVIEETGE